MFTVTGWLNVVNVRTGVLMKVIYVSISIWFINSLRRGISSWSNFWSTFFSIISPSTNREKTPKWYVFNPFCIGTLAKRPRIKIMRLPNDFLGRNTPFYFNASKKIPSYFKWDNICNNTAYIFKIFDVQCNPIWISIHYFRMLFLMIIQIRPISNETSRFMPIWAISLTYIFKKTFYIFKLFVLIERIYISFWPGLLALMTWNISYIYFCRLLVHTQSYRHSIHPPVTIHILMIFAYPFPKFHILRPSSAFLWKLQNIRYELRHKL